jgi:hypothetical protein
VQTYRIVVANEEGGAIRAAPSESVSAQSMPTKSVAAKRMTAKRMTAERVSTKSMPTKSMSTHEKFPSLTSPGAVKPAGENGDLVKKDAMQGP